jgi:cytochrome b pre-mRNA-processing protein 3
MRFPLFGREARGPITISTLYGTIVAQARLPCFYRAYAVADTVNGRFDLIVLHIALVLERFSADPDLREVGQGLFDRFWRDMDHNLREMGVGDLSVPKKMRELGEAFYGRAKAYRAALGADDRALAAALLRNIYGGAQPDAARRLAVYMRRAARDLAGQEKGRLATGEVSFPDPAAILAATG